MKYSHTAQPGSRRTGTSRFRPQTAGQAGKGRLLNAQLSGNQSMGLSQHTTQISGKGIQNRKEFGPKHHRIQSAASRDEARRSGSTFMINNSQDYTGSSKVGLHIARNSNNNFKTAAQNQTNLAMTDAENRRLQNQSCIFNIG